jgi:hypothetical protein
MDCVFTEQPFADRALLWMLDGLLSAGAERLTYLDCQQQGDLPSHMAGDGVVRSQDRLGNVGNEGHLKMQGWSSLGLSEKFGET